MTRYCKLPGVQVFIFRISAITRAWIEINPLDAERLGIEGRDSVVVRSPHGGITVEARLNSAIPERILFASDHFRDAVINKLTQNTSLCQVTIEKKQ